ncbi:archease [Dehalogenimonas etheniformans]|uniref:Archease n=1 Tax=Dehalogenimonas etheniformans TaxID=1536648 RepID=A0A2P5P8G3_9CHLR|nr:archease [Dehalogenimonas etheniformans]PPD58593.1 archease [Dehalogenimonas etheniformans]QNT76642.1 archease [Dehalogenimonas etheniformans]
MSYRFIPEEATADIAFEASGDTLEECFRAAVEAVLNVMVDNPEAVLEIENRNIKLNNNALDLLLFDLLQKIVFFKDAEQLLLHLDGIVLNRMGTLWRLSATGKGEFIDPKRHRQRADVKAVTFHNFTLEQTEKGWRAHVILDI